MRRLAPAFLSLLLLAAPSPAARVEVTTVNISHHPGR
jgi:hypothetical protein